MNPVLRKSLVLRFAATPLLFATRQSILGTVLMLIFLDIIDCNPLVLKLFPPEYANTGCSYDATYQLLDKSLDIFQYIVAIALLRPILPKSIFMITLFFLAFRIIGMIVYLFNKNNNTFIFFIDFIKEYLTLFALIGQPSTLILSGAIILKVGYEYLMHQQHIFLDLYRVIFE